MTDLEAQSIKRVLMHIDKGKIAAGAELLRNLLVRSGYPLDPAAYPAIKPDLVKVPGPDGYVLVRADKLENET